MDKETREEQKEKRLQEKLKKEALGFRKELAKKTLNLMTSAFGLVAALAWNELIKEAINVYIKPFFGKGSGIISLAIYAVAITLLAVLVTYNLSRFAEKKD
jgi:hypothetical protein